MGQENSLRRVVVTGMGMVTPLGCGVEHIWARLIAGGSGAKAIDTFDVSDIHAAIPPLGGRQPAASARQNNTWWFIGGAFAALIAFLVIFRKPAPPD